MAGGALDGAAALPDLQRRRVRARHFQGPRADGARSVLADRGDDDRGLRHRLRKGVSLPSRRVPAGAGADRERPPALPRPRLPRRQHPGRRRALRDRAAARRRGLHLRRGDGADELAGGAPRRAAQQAAVPHRGRPVRQADGDQQRRDPGQRAPHRDRGREGLRRHRHRAFDRPQALLRLRPREPPRGLRGAVRHHSAASCSIWPAASAAAAVCRPCCWAARPAPS